MRTFFTSFLFCCLCLGSFAQQNGKKIIQYNYYVSSVTSEEVLQQVAAKLNSYSNITGCKYRMKPGKQTGELSFTTEEKPLQSEHDKSNELPDVKTIIVQSGLRYESFTSHMITPE